MDFILILILGAVTWCVASEGAWGAALTCLCVILSGLLAMNFFEPMANFLQNSLGWRGGWPYRWDIISMVGIFAASVFAIRAATDRISPTYIQVPGGAYEIIRWGCGLLTGYVTMAFLLTSLHTALLPREFIGFKPERNNLFNICAPDRQWLGFTQFVSERSFRTGRVPRVFDGPQIVLGDEEQPYPNTIWPSFPIRYASRRERLGSAQPVAPPVTTPGGTATPAPQQGRQPAPTRRQQANPGF